MGKLLMPPAEHFTTSGSLIVNPSYWMPLAIHELATSIAEPRLAAAAEHGARLLWDLASAGPTPDWIELTAAGWRPFHRNGAAIEYEAIRVPLWLIWSGRPAHPTVSRMLSLPGRSSASPTSDLGTGSVLDVSSDPGYQSVLTLAGCAHGRMIEQPTFTASQSYYAASSPLFVLENRSVSHVEGVGILRMTHRASTENARVWYPETFLECQDELFRLIGVADERRPKALPVLEKLLDVGSAEDAIST